MLIDLGLQNGAHILPTSTPRGLQEPLGTHLCLQAAFVTVFLSCSASAGVFFQTFLACVRVGCCSCFLRAGRAQKNAPQPEDFVFSALFQASEIRCFLLRLRTKTNSSHALIFDFPRHAFFFDFGLQNGAKTTPESSSRRLQEPLGTEVRFTRQLKRHFVSFWPPTWPQHRAQDRLKLEQNPTWPPKGRQEASKDPSWAQLGPMLACFERQVGPKKAISEQQMQGQHLQSLPCTMHGLPASSRWLPARWPASGAQPHWRSGHRASKQAKHC